MIENDGTIDQSTFPIASLRIGWQMAPLTGGNILWQYYDEEWVFTIADLVYQNQVVTNSGIKNLQIWFFPVDSTEFIPF